MSYLETVDVTPSLETIGTVGTLNLKSGNYLSVKDFVVLKLAFTLSAQVITLVKLVRQFQRVVHQV